MWRSAPGARAVIATACASRLSPAAACAAADAAFLLLQHRTIMLPTPQARLQHSEQDHFSQPGSSPLAASAACSVRLLLHSGIASARGRLPSPPHHLPYYPPRRWSRQQQSQCTAARGRRGAQQRSAAAAAAARLLPSYLSLFLPAEALTLWGRHSLDPQAAQRGRERKSGASRRSLSRSKLKHRSQARALIPRPTPPPPLHWRGHEGRAARAEAAAGQQSCGRHHRQGRRGHQAAAAGQRLLHRHPRSQRRRG
jgi:hypothetical protein